MYIYPSQYKILDYTNIGNIIRLLTSKDYIPLNFANVMDFKVMDITKYYVTINIYEPIRTFNFLPSGNIDISVLPDTVQITNKFCHIQLKYIWLSNKNETTTKLNLQ